MASYDFGYQVNEDMKQELKAQKFKSDRLRRLLQIFSGERVQDETKDKMTEMLAGPFRDETEEFLINLERVRSENISLPRARDHFYQEYNIDKETVDEMGGNLELLLLVYELQESGKMDSTDFETLMAYASIFAEKSQEVYVLEEDIDLDNVEEKVRGHLERTNDHNRHALGAQINSHEERVKIKLFSEYGRKPYVSFEFREDGTESPPSDPQVEYSPSYPLKTIRLELREVPEGTEVIFSKDPKDGWKTRLEEFFKGTFDVSDVFERLERRESEIAAEIRQGAKDAADEDEDTVGKVESIIEKRREEMVNEFEGDEESSDEEVQQFVDRLGSVRLSGFIISDDQNTQTDNFRLVSDNFTGFLNSVDSMDEGLDAYLKEADDENIQVVVEIEDEKVRIQGNTWSPLYGKMSQENLETLRYFFDTFRNEE